MIDLTGSEVDNGTRTDGATLDGVISALHKLFADRTMYSTSVIVNGMTYADLIKLLMQVRDDLQDIQDTAE